MRGVRALVLAVAAFAVGTPLPPVVAAGPDHAVLLASDFTTSTPFVTDPARTYQVTVTGVVARADGAALYDCGHRFENGEWYSYPILVVPLSPAPCNNMPFSPTHTYTWWQPGTGTAMSFRLWDGTAREKVGPMVIDVLDVTDQMPLAGSGTAYDVDGSCEVVTVDDSQADVRVLAIAVHAESRLRDGASPEPPPLLDAHCRVSVVTTQYARVWTDVPAPVVATGRVVVVPRQPYSVCLSIGVTYVGRPRTSVDEPCRTV